MSQTQSRQDPVSLPPRMKSALERYRRRVWIIKVAEGLLAGIFGLVMSYLVVFGLDRLFDTPAALRAVILVAGSVGMLILFPLKCHNWVWSHRRLDQVARLLRHKYPRFGDHMMGIVELAQADSQQGASRALVEAAMRQVDAELEGKDLSDAVPFARHRRWAWATGVPLVLIAVVMVLIPAAGGNAFARWLTPWQDVERYTFAQLEGDDGRRVVPYAEPFNIEAILKEDSPWKPESAKARYAKQKPLVAKRDGTSYKFKMPPQTSDGNVSVRVGDTRRSIPVEPKMRPALNELFAEIQLPEYLEREEPLIEDARGGAVSLVKGSAAVFKATATRDLAEATLDDRSQSVDGSVVTTDSLAVETSKEYRLAWRDKYGLEAREPLVLRVDARDDEGPNVTLGKLKNNQVVLSTQVLAFEIQAGDDFGVKQVGIEWQGMEDPIHNPEPSKGEKIVAAGAPVNDRMTVPATFSADREGVPAQSMHLRAYAEDYLPGRERSYSPYLLLHVLTPTEHFQWLIDQMGQWAGAAQEVYDKELQLHEVNKELMALPPEALDDPAQRKKIQNQAAAEKANAAILDSLIDMGKELVQEAGKNEEFDAEQLESWAEMLKALEEIAGIKMPSVADLLAEAAAAPGQPKEPPPGAPTDQSEPGKPTDDPPEDGPQAPAGGKPNDLEKADKYGPDSKKPPEGLDEFPEDPNEPGGEVNVDRSKPAEGKPGYLPANPTPLVLDHESGFNKSDKAEDVPQIVGGLGIPSTMLKGSGRNDEDEEEAAPSTGELVIQAVTEQQELLDAFALLAADMNKLLLGFENSTFVKRLKAASRRQIDLAVELNSLDSFGLNDDAVDNGTDLARLSGSEVAESETIFTLQEDMVAYADRRPSHNYERVLGEMQLAVVVSQVRDIAPLINENAVGQSTIEAEFWADTLDRWAEQLVDPLPKAPPGTLGLIILPNLTPEIVLEVLRIINIEIDLREETRELHQAREALEEEVYEERGTDLSETQKELAEKARELVEQIKVLPKADELGNHIEKLTNAAVVMDEVVELLATPKTGPPTIAALQEVLETLLETIRLPNAPMLVKVAPTSTSAIVLMGMGNDESKAFIESRAPSQSTGIAGRELPQEFRQGLDAYLNALEGRPVQ